MLYVLTGKDDYSKKSFVSGLAVKEKTTVVQVGLEQNPLDFTSSSLFGEKGVYVLLKSDLLKDESVIQELQSSSNAFVVYDTGKSQWPKSVDLKRFDAPKISELHQWIQNYLQQKNITIDADASAYITETLFGKAAAFGEGDVDLHLLDMELSKLVLVAENGRISKAVAEVFISKVYDPGGFRIVDAFAKKDSAEFFSLYNTYFGHSTQADLQGKVISLVALFADQLRSMLLMYSGYSDSDILAMTGWKSGRLFVVKKQAAGFSEAALLATLKKLEALDEEIKTGHPAPLTILTMILSQII